jgi:hypothetical protein
MEIERAIKRGFRLVTEEEMLAKKYLFAFLLLMM